MHLMKTPLFLLMAILISACTGYHYVASPQLVPLHTKKGEFQANVYLSGAQVSYAFSNHFSAFATGYKRFGPGEYLGNPLKGANKENSGVIRRGAELLRSMQGSGIFNPGAL